MECVPSAETYDGDWGDSEVGGGVGGGSSPSPKVGLLVGAPPIVPVVLATAGTAVGGGNIAYTALGSRPLAVDSGDSGINETDVVDFECKFRVPCLSGESQGWGLFWQGSGCRSKDRCDIYTVAAGMGLYLYFDLQKKTWGV